MKGGSGPLPSPGLLHFALSTIASKGLYKLAFALRLKVLLAFMMWCYGGNVPTVPV